MESLMFTLLNRFKKCITLMLCAALFNACVVPSAALLAAKRPVTQKQRIKPVKPIDKKIDKTEEASKEKPTWQETWKR